MAFTSALKCTWSAQSLRSLWVATVLPARSDMREKRADSKFLNQMRSYSRRVVLAALIKSRAIAGNTQVTACRWPIMPVLNSLIWSFCSFILLDCYGDPVCREFSLPKGLEERVEYCSIKMESGLWLAIFRNCIG